MPKNKMNDLRNHLFETLENLKDPDKPLDIARAKAVCAVAQTIINSVTVEVKAMNAMGRETPLKFFEGEQEKSQLAAGGSESRKPNGRSHI